MVDVRGLGMLVLVLVVDIGFGMIGEAGLQRAVFCAEWEQEQQQEERSIVRSLLMS